METQILTLRPNHPLYISTPLGLVTLERVKNDNRKLKFVLPPGFRAFVGDKPNLRESEFVDGEGRVKPGFAMKMLVTNENDELVGIQEPTAFRLENNDGNPGTETVADGEDHHGGGHPPDGLQAE